MMYYAIVRTIEDHDVTDKSQFPPNVVAEEVDPKIGAWNVDFGTKLPECDFMEIIIRDVKFWIEF